MESTCCENDRPNNLDLNKAYSCSMWTKRTMSPDEIIADFLQRSEEYSTKFLSEGVFQSQRNVTYGRKEREKLDIFSPKAAERDAPVFMFLHGGYWQAKELSKDNNCLLGGPLIKNGVIFVSVGYSLAPECTVHDMVEEVKQAVVCVAKTFPETRGIYICGHSAGGHLAAMMLSVDWLTILGTNKNIVKGILPISGVFDIRPITKTYINEALGLTESSASSISPLLLVDAIPKCNIGIKVDILLAEYDPPVFHEQAQDYTRLLSSIGLDVEMQVVPERDHFEEILDLPNENCFLQKVILKAMGMT